MSAWGPFWIWLGGFFLSIMLLYLFLRVSDLQDEHLPAWEDDIKMILGLSVLWPLVLIFLLAWGLGHFTFKVLLESIAQKIARRLSREETPTNEEVKPVLNTITNTVSSRSKWPRKTKI